MGKRELLIAVGFVVAGVVAYWLLGPSQPAPAPPHSLPALVDEWRDRAAESAVHASATTSGSRPVPDALTELRLSGFTDIEVVGEDRSDLSWSMTAEATAATAAAADATAQSTRVVADDLGASLALSPSRGEARVASIRLALKVPRRLALRLEDARRATVSAVAAVRVDGLVGDVVIRQVAGGVTGTHRTGRLEVEDAGTVTLNMVGTRAVISRIRQDVALTMRNGEGQISASSGALGIDATGAAIVVTMPRGAVRANVTGGSLEVRRPAEAVHVDVRRARLLLDLDRAVPATIVATNTAVGVHVDPEQPLTVDATAAGGTIDASAFGLTPERSGRDARLMHAFGTGARLVIRATDGAIVIDRRK